MDSVEFPILNVMLAKSAGEIASSSLDIPMASLEVEAVALGMPTIFTLATQALVTVGVDKLAAHLVSLESLMERFLIQRLWSLSWL